MLSRLGSEWPEVETTRWTWQAIATGGWHNLIHLRLGILTLDHHGVTITQEVAYILNALNKRLLHQCMQILVRHKLMQHLYEAHQMTY